MASARPTPRTPYEAALGAAASARLHPALRTYFSALRSDEVGIGEGVFQVIGARHRWIRWMLAPLSRRGVVFAGWRWDIPFRITNRLLPDGRLTATRELRLGEAHTWTMTDSVTVNSKGRVVDVLGRPPLVAASFTAAVTDGALTLRSHTVGVRVAGHTVRIPRAVSPIIRLRERFDESAGRQHVDITLTVPVLGTIYEYRGYFEYRVERKQA